MIRKTKLIPLMPGGRAGVGRQPTKVSEPHQTGIFPLDQVAFAWHNGKMQSRAVFALLFGSITATAFAEINYNLQLEPLQKLNAVTITIPTHGEKTTLQIAKWGPGSYVYSNFAANIKDVQATDGNGAILTVAHPDDNTWVVPAAKGPLKVSYTITTGSDRRFGRQDASVVQVSGPATYMYVVNRKPEHCKLHVEVPNNWPVLTGLDEIRGQPNTFAADSYDTLADNPISSGDVLVDTYTVAGKPHYIVLEGQYKGDVDRARLIRDCKLVSGAEGDFFGGLPYHKYVWHFSVTDAADGAGGLEHLASTQISLSSGEGPRAQSVLAHEFFHLWNVKRTRSKPLGPFDYQVLPRTGALWWLEGVTDYYASVLPYRYGMWDVSELEKNLARNVSAVRANPARLQVSPNESSMRVADANQGRGNSNGYLISYYNLGWLCGLCLDTEIRYQTKGKHSLDDVTRALFQECKNNQPGFAEDEIRKQCIRFGGAALGPFYDKVVMQPGELPIGEQLAKVGMAMSQHDESYTNLGFRYQPNRAQGGLIVLRDPNADPNAKLQSGDVITAINGQAPDTSSGRKMAAWATGLLEKATPGTAISLTVKRGTADPMTVEITPTAGTRKAFTVDQDPNANEGAKALRDGWLIHKNPMM